MDRIKLQTDLNTQVGYFKQSNSSVREVAFEINNGNECLRVGIQSSREPDRLCFDYGYSPKDYGFDDPALFKRAIRDILEGKCLNYQRFSFFRKFGEFFDSFFLAID